MYSPYLIPTMVSAAASFLEGYLQGRRRQQNLSSAALVEQMQLQNLYLTLPYLHNKAITNIELAKNQLRLIEKVCQYCGRVNTLKKNCEGCGAPCK